MSHKIDCPFLCEFDLVISILLLISVSHLPSSEKPSWTQVKVVFLEFGDNFLISNADLKKLELLSKTFPNILARGATLIWIQ